METTELTAYRQLQAEARAYESIAMTFLSSIQHQVRRTNHDDYFPFIPMPLREAYHQLRIVSSCFSPNYPPNFLDVGAGIGNIMALARIIGMRSYGIEVDKRLQKFTNFRWQKWGGRLPMYEAIFNEDALTFEGYKHFDVIYFYRPIRNGKLQRELEHLIEENMKVGAYYIANHKQDIDILRSKSFKRLIKQRAACPDVWKKVKP